MSFPLATFAGFCSSLELFVSASYGKSFLSQIAHCKTFLLSMPRTSLRYVLAERKKMSIIYLVSPKKTISKYIYDKSDLKKRLEKNKSRPGNERVIPKANFENIKFGRFKGSKNALFQRYRRIFDEVELRTVVNFNDNDWEIAKKFEKIIKHNCFGNYKKLINTKEWIDDKRLNMNLAEKLVFSEYKKFINKYENI